MIDDDDVLDDGARSDFAAMIIAGRPLGKIADELGVHKRTITRWRQQPELIAAVARARTEVLGGVIGALTTSALESVATLAAIRDDVEASNGDRIRAASILLSELRHTSAALELDQRISDLEHAAEAVAEQRRELEQPKQQTTEQGRI